MDNKQQTVNNESNKRRGDLPFENIKKDGKIEMAINYSDMQQIISEVDSVLTNLKTLQTEIDRILIDVSEKFEYFKDSFNKREKKQYIQQDYDDNLHFISQLLLSRNRDFKKVFDWAKKVNSEFENSQCKIDVTFDII